MKNKINENRPLAFAVLAVVVVLSIILSGGGGLRAMRDEVLRTFHVGVNGDGLCVHNDMTQRGDCAYNLADLAARYDSIPQSAIQSVIEAADDLHAADAEDTFALKAANEKLGRAVEALYTELENTSLSETDATYALSQYKEFTSRGLTISRDGYNSLALEFNRTVSAFPASLVARISGVGELALFN